MTPEQYEEYLKKLKDEEKNKNMQLQEKLKAAGLYDGNIDGIIGPKTKKALQRYEYLKKNKATDKSIRKTKYSQASIIPLSARMFLNNLISAPIERITGINLGTTYNRANVGTQNQIEEMIANKMIERFGSIDNAKKYFEKHPEKVIKDGWYGRNSNNKNNFQSDYQKYYGKSYNDLTSGSSRAKALLGDNLADVANSIGSANMFVSKEGVRMPDDYDFMGKKANNSIKDKLKSGQFLEALRIAADRYGTREGVDNTTTRFDTSVGWDDLLKHEQNIKEKKPQKSSKPETKHNSKTDEETPLPKSNTKTTNNTPNTFNSLKQKYGNAIAKNNISQKTLNWYSNEMSKTSPKFKDMSEEELIKRYISGLKLVGKYNE